jgi:hypothetical protein
LDNKSLILCINYFIARAFPKIAFLIGIISAAGVRLGMMRAAFPDEVPAPTD